MSKMSDLMLVLVDRVVKAEIEAADLRARCQKAERSASEAGHDRKIAIAARDQALEKLKAMRGVEVPASPSHQG